MKKILILVIAAALLLGALNFHFILTDSGPRVLKKTALTFDHTFVDARGRKKHKLLTTPALVKAGIQDLFE
jgi:hypothetical protein